MKTALTLHAKIVMALSFASGVSKKQISTIHFSITNKTVWNGIYVELVLLFSMKLFTISLNKVGLMTMLKFKNYFTKKRLSSSYDNLCKPMVKIDTMNWQRDSLAVEKLQATHSMRFKISTLSLLNSQRNLKLKRINLQKNNKMTK